jgi:hypothetical protein
MPHVNCPTPSCSYQLDPATVPAGATVACPRCGQRFRVGPAPAPAYRPRPAADGVGFGTVLVAVGGALLVLGVIAAGVVISGRFKGGKPTGEPAADEFADLDRNFAVRMPGPPWQRSAQTAADMGVTVFALHRPDPPEAWAALSVSDFKDRSPLDSELRGKMAEHLGRLFLNLPDELPTEPTTVGGKPGLRCQFRGEHKKTGRICTGDAIALGHRGVGYWLYTWAAERDADAAADELARVRDGFRILDGRASWSEKTGAEVMFRGPAGGYRLSCYEPIWKPQPVANDDPKPDLELVGMLQGKQQREYTPRANVIVWVVAGAKADDPLTAAEQFVRKQLVKDEEVFGKREIMPVEEPPTGDPPAGPEGGRPTGRLRVAPADPNVTSGQKLVVYSGLPTDAGLVVAMASCPWAERAIWERRLIQLVGSLRP